MPTKASIARRPLATDDHECGDDECDADEHNRSMYTITAWERSMYTIAAWEPLHMHCDWYGLESVRCLCSNMPGVSQPQNCAAMLTNL